MKMNQEKNWAVLVKVQTGVLALILFVLLFGIFQNFSHKSTDIKTSHYDCNLRGKIIYV